MVQRRAARFILQRYRKRSSVTTMLNELQLESLQERRYKADVTMLYKIQHQLVAVPIPSILVRPQRLKPEKPHLFHRPSCNTEAYGSSYFPRSILLWNSLPPTLASMDSLSSFKAALSKHKLDSPPSYKAVLSKRTI